LYKNKNEFFEALKYYNKSLQTYQLKKERGLEAITFQEIATVYKSQGEYDKSLENYKMSEQLLLEDNNLEQLAELYLYIGDIHVSNRKYDEARTYFSKSLTYYKEKENKIGEANVMNHYGMSYERLSPKKSISFYTKSLKISENEGGKFSMIQSYTGMAYAYERQKKYEKAIEYYSKSIQLSEEIGYVQGVAEASYNIEKLENKK